MAQATAEEWVTIAEAARRLGMSQTWFKQWAATAGVIKRRRGRRSGVNWASVEEVIRRSRLSQL